MMAELDGLPPLPKCFSGCVNSNLSQSWREASTSVEPVPSPDSQDTSSSADTTIGVEVSFEHQFQIQSEKCTVHSEVQHTADHQDATENLNDFATSNGVFDNLNSALQKLRDEMAGLRQLDVSLLNQLWSLNEAIQEYKNVMQDRYSETNSEYSFGMSRTSSMGSIDECDWNEEMHAKMGFMDGSLDGSTSSLLQQINQLAERAELEF